MEIHLPSNYNVRKEIKNGARFLQITVSGIRTGPNECTIPTTIKWDSVFNYMSATNDVVQWANGDKQALTTSRHWFTSSCADPRLAIYVKSAEATLCSRPRWFTKPIYDLWIKRTPIGRIARTSTA